MYKSETTIRVRYGETDQMGYSYYGNYALYFEVGRVEALRQIGTSYRELEENGIMMPVLELKCKYIKPAKYDDLLIISTIVKEMPQARMFFDYEIKNEAGELIHLGSTSLVFVNSKTMRPTRCPEFLSEKIKKYFDDVK